MAAARWSIFRTRLQMRKWLTPEVGRFVGVGILNTLTGLLTIYAAKWFLYWAHNADVRSVAAASFPAPSRLTHAGHRGGVKGVSQPGRRESDRDTLDSDVPGSEILSFRAGLISLGRKGSSVKRTGPCI